MSQQRSWSVLGASVVFALMAVACGPSTTISHSWKAANVQLSSLRNVATVYVSPDGALRRTIEDKLALELNRQGIQAVPSYKVLTDTDRDDREQARAKLLAAGIDGVVAIRLVSRDTSSFATFDGYWGSAYPTLYGPSSYYTETIVRAETDAYSLKENRLLWSAVSKTVDPASSTSVVNEVTALVAGQLRKQGVVASSATRNTEG